MLLRFQKAVRGNYGTGTQDFSMHLRFLTIRRRNPLKKQQVVTKHGKPFFSVLFAFSSEFAGICRNFHYVSNTVRICLRLIPHLRMKRITPFFPLSLQTPIGSRESVTSAGIAGLTRSVQCEC